MSDVDDFQIQIKRTFLIEASQFVEECEGCLLTIENNNYEFDQENFNKIFRLFHSLKGSGRAVGFKDLADFTHELEQMIQDIRNRDYDINLESVNLILECCDLIRKHIQDLEEDLESSLAYQSYVVRIKTYCEKAKRAKASGVSPDQLSDAAVPLPDDASVSGSPEPVARTPEEPKEDSGGLHLFDDDEPETEEIKETEEMKASSAIDDHQNPVESPEPESDVSLQDQDQDQDRVQDKQLTTSEADGQSADQSSVDQEKATLKKSASSDNAIRISQEKIDNLLDYIGEMTILQTVLKEHVFNHKDIKLQNIVDQLSKASKEVQNTSMQFRMVPVKPIIFKLKRIVRDIAMTMDKSIQVEVIGEDMEVDKNLLDQISDPLVHIVRNSADHGIETKSDRSEKGKNPGGKIIISVEQENGRLVFKVEDDGKGLNPEYIFESAVKKNLISANQVLSDKEIINLIFEPGFSTKQEVSDISGRGFGMDVVKSNVELIGGAIEVTSAVNKGSCFKMSLPQTLAIVDALIVQSSNQRFAIPLAHVKESVKLKEKDLKETHEIGTVFILRGDNLKAVFLNHMIHLKSDDATDRQGIAIVTNYEKNNYALIVDDILGLNQIVVKQVGNELSHLEQFSGSTILSDGNPALILEMSSLYKNDVKQPIRGVAA